LGANRVDPHKRGRASRGRRRLRGGQYGHGCDECDEKTPGPHHSSGLVSRG
jgi:hypothetical protein